MGTKHDFTLSMHDRIARCLGGLVDINAALILERRQVDPVREAADRAAQVGWGVQPVQAVTGEAIERARFLVGHAGAGPCGRQVEL